MYFASDPLLARFEARDVLGHWHGAAVAPPPDSSRHVVVEYAIELGPDASVVDARPAQLDTVETTVQEMTGDWETYPRRGSPAPTQNLARTIYDRADEPMGLLAPSARNPRLDNLVLFAHRLPPRSIALVGTHVWHPQPAARSLNLHAAMHLRLDERLTAKLGDLPDSGMGDQRVDVRLRNGDHVRSVLVFNAEIMEWPDITLAGHMPDPRYPFAGPPAMRRCDPHLRRRLPDI